MKDTERKLVIEMRQRTNLPFLKCRDYLAKANWDICKAIDLAQETRWWTRSRMLGF